MNRQGAYLLGGAVAAVWLLNRASEAGEEFERGFTAIPRAGARAGDWLRLKLTDFMAWASGLDAEQEATLSEPDYWRFVNGE